jgi:hypothetical protein
MRFTGILTAALLATGVLATTPAFAANVCKAERLSCATTMPVGGFCQCTSRGNTEDGTVVQSGAARGKVNATGAGCGADPKAPGCR